MALPKYVIKRSEKRTSDNIIHQSEDTLTPNRKNFIFMAIAGAMIVVGFLLMLGPSSTSQQFEPDIFSTRRIVVGPLIAFLGYVAMAIAIIVNPKASKSKQKDA